ncbi:MAG: NCS2 family permease [Armatimonadetes bacterium]|nr:NCS2 family permease [Candidatus Hippobium faecium]
MRLFDTEKKGTTVRCKIMAGMTTFFAVCYILIVNAGMFSDIPGVSFGAVYIGTAIATILGTLILALLTDLPIVQSTGLGVNAFFIYTCCRTFGFSYANSLMFVLLDGIIFLILTVTGLRKIIYEALPKCINKAIPAGICIFISFIGFQNAKIIVPDPETCLALNSFSLLLGKWPQLMPFIVAMLTLISMVVMHRKNIKGSIFISIILGSILYYILGLTVPGCFSHISINFDPWQAFREFYDISFLKVFREGFDFSHYLSQNGATLWSLSVTFITTVFAFCMLNMYDSLGTLFGLCRLAGLTEKDRKGKETVPNLNKAMMSDAIATCIGAVCGTSTQTFFMESATGIGAGGRTKITGITVCVLFVLAMFFSNLCALIPPCVCNTALIFIGILMIEDIAEIISKDITETMPAFITVFMMTFTCNVSYGIGLGLISYVLIKIFMGKGGEIKPVTWIVFLLFVILMITH